MQLLKLVYLAHGWALGLYGRPLIKDEIQAWRYGPVIPSLYQAVKDYRGGPVLVQIPMTQRENVTAAQASVIEQVYDLYGSKSGPALSRLTHAPGSPWAQVYDPDEFGTVIPDDIIMDHYKRLADAHGGSTPADPA